MCSSCHPIKCTVFVYMSLMPTRSTSPYLYFQKTFFLTKSIGRVYIYSGFKRCLFFKYYPHYYLKRLLHTAMPSCLRTQCRRQLQSQGTDSAEEGRRKKTDACAKCAKFGILPNYQNVYKTYWYLLNYRTSL